MSQSEKWQKKFLGDLPVLREKQLIDEATAQRLADYYSQQLVQDKAASARYLVAALAVVGALLVAAGVILFINYNWHSLGKPLQIALSLTPLALSGLLSAYALSQGKGRPWLETCALLNMAANITACALLSQIYNIHGSWEKFCLLVLTTSLPLLYIFDSFGVFTVFNLLLWTVSRIYYGTSTWLDGLPALLIVATIPFLIKHIYKKDSLHPRLARNLLLLPAFGLFWTTYEDIRDCPALLAVLLTAGFYVSGLLRQSADPTRRRNLHLAFGGTALAIILCFLYAPDTADNAWGYFAGNLFGTDTHPVIILLLLTTHLIALLALAWQLARAVRRRAFSAPVCVAAAIAAAALLAEMLSCLFPYSFLLDRLLSLLFSALALAWGLVLLRDGFRHLSLHDMNCGLALLGLLIVIHFFSNDFGTLPRAAAFLTAGVLFIVGNVALARRLKQHTGTPASREEEAQA